MSFRSFTLAICILLVSGETQAPIATEIPLPESIVIKLQQRGMRILPRNEVNQKSCGDYSQIHTSISSDFDGDGYRDYAVLVDAGQRSMMWKGKTLLFHELQLLAFLQRNNGQYERFLLEKLPDYLPAGYYVNVQPPGKIKEWDSENYHILKNSGIVRIRCESAILIFHWIGNEFSSILVSD